ncbi:MerR family transcriptional regulator [Heyndrickxia oleronia]|uniref:helix-turn-helix domain-containing protein n=1 Tax=Heyndrickxia TaxID=2837504 RepID=UPI001BB3BF64|nr:MerR family transcriptional regulator [Heyndrickxia oleronia]MCM3452600.1 MerR family transcriptional regulator [Heyndrickxia oleronia]
MNLSINEFSKRTGLPPSKLRFYDKKRLLVPFVRLENGYRAYAFDQIYQAKMIDSLRQAGISIQDIKQYFTVNDQEKKKILDRWREDLNKRTEVLLAAQKFIGGINVENPQQTLLLSNWETEKYFVWQRVHSQRQPNPFQKHFTTAKSQLEKLGVTCSEQVYVKTEMITEDKIIGEIGFEVLNNSLTGDHKDFRIEKVSPTLFAVLQDCRPEDALFCFSYIQVIIRYGFQPIGSKLERYSNIDASTFDYLIPVVK